MRKYMREFVVPSFQTNQMGQVTICALLQQMLEAAWAHACEMDWGYDDLKNHHLFWVLSRLYVEVDYFPLWQDKIMLETWSSGTDGIYAYREFLLKDGQGKPFLRANTAWLILNSNSRKLVLLRDQKATFPRLNTESPCRAPRRLRPGKYAQQGGFHPVCFSDLDVNKHFNSVRYVERTLDEFGIDFLGNCQVNTLEINFLKEGMPGDLLAVHFNFPEAGCLSQATVIRESDQANLITMEIEWKKRVRDGH